MGACGSSPGPTVSIDFENCSPSASEKEQYDKLETTFVEAERVLKLIEDYKGCQDLARAAMSQPTPQNEKAAFEGLLVSVESIAAFFNFSKALDKIVQHLLLTLAQNANALDTQQALCKQLARVFDFVLRFDDAKMINPAIQNDFSYYRRSLSKHKNKVEVKIKDDLANRMSLFFAYPTPMLRVITETTVNMVKSNAIQKTEVVAGFTLMANVCLEMVEMAKFSNATTNLFLSPCYDCCHCFG